MIDQIDGLTQLCSKPTVLFVQTLTESQVFRTVRMYYHVHPDHFPFCFGLDNMWGQMHNRVESLHWRVQKLRDLNFIPAKDHWEMLCTKLPPSRVAKRSLVQTLSQCTEHVSINCSWYERQEVGSLESHHDASCLSNLVNRQYNISMACAYTVRKLSEGVRSCQVPCLTTF